MRKQKDYNEIKTSRKEGSKNQKKSVLSCKNNKIPDSILNNEFLNQMILALPKNYNFEIHKSIWRIEEMKKELGKESIMIVLQMPQGLQMFACALSDIFEHFTNSEVRIIIIIKKISVIKNLPKI